MPLLRFDLIEGRTSAELKTLLDAAHRAVLHAFGVPQRDRYQIVHEHKASHMIVEDTGLGIPRTGNIVLLQITTRPHSITEKQELYKTLCYEFELHCGIAPSDVMISLVVNEDEDWSFGHGRAQFITGEL